MARRNGLDEIPELVTLGLIREQANERVERPQLQPSRSLDGGDLERTTQRCSGSISFSVAMSQLTIDALQLASR